MPQLRGNEPILGLNNVLLSEGRCFVDLTNVSGRMAQMTQFVSLYCYPG
jgi:hypothetical protein